VFVSAEFDAYLVTHAPGAQPVDVDDTDGTDPEFVWIGDGGPATIVVTSANPGETGGYEITVLAADLDYMAPVPQHLAAPNEPNEPATPAAPERPGGPPQIPPAPKLEGNAPLDLTRVEWGVEAPEPGTASDLLTQGLHRMNYIEVEIWGQMDCYEANAWPEREWPRGFGWSIDNYLQGAAGGPPVKCPLTWTGDIFSAYGMQPNGEGGHMERVHVTGRVSANGDRILWVLVRSFEQGVYEDEDDRFASYQEWKSLGLVDLPLNNPHWQAYGDERVTTMAELMGKIDETLVLRDGFTYAWESHGDAGKHVMEAGYMLRAPGQGDQWLVPGDLHMLSYRSTEWQNGDNPPTVRLRFEYNERLE